MILGFPGTLSEKHVSSKKLECSEYGTPAVSGSREADITPTEHHALPRGAADRAQRDVTEPASLVALDNKVDVWQHVCTSWCAVGPSRRPEGKGSLEVRVQHLKVWLQPLELDVPERYDMDLTLRSVGVKRHGEAADTTHLSRIVTKHAMQFRIGLGQDDAPFALISVDLGVKRPRDRCS